MNRRATVRALAAITVPVLLTGVTAGTVTATTPPDDGPLFVIELTEDSAAPDAPVPVAPQIRPTPYVVAQGLIELDAGRSWQWQVHDVDVSPTGTTLNATANLFVFSEQTLAFASHSAPVASVLGGPDEVLAAPVGTTWTLSALGVAPAPTTIFGLGHEAGGTAPAGEPFTVESGGLYQIEVRAYQLLPGDVAEFGDGSASTLLLVRSGNVTTPMGDVGAGERVTGNRGELINASDEPADVLAAAVIEIPAELAGRLAVAPPPPPTTSAPAATDPPATAAPSSTAAPATTSAPTTTEAPRAPVAANDSASSTGGNPASVNVFSNDDRGNPQASIVTLSHGGSTFAVGAPFDTGNGTVIVTADGTATLTVANTSPGSTTTYSIFYTIENAHGSSVASVDFSVEG